MMKSDLNKDLNVLLLENIHPNARKHFTEAGYSVDVLSKSLEAAELSKRIQQVHILGIRSKTRLTAELIEKAENLLAVGAFCIGTNQIDLTAATRQGMAVFNAPYSNTRSVVELALGEIIMLMRGVYEKCSKLHAGEWRKSAKNNFEVRGKKLGIIGYGNIGAQLSVLAEALGMDVCYYDIIDKLTLGNAKKCDTMEELLEKVDVVSIHVDGRAENQNMISKEQFQRMRDGVIFLNISRGFVVDIPALVEYIKSGKVRGAAVDVFPREPGSNAERFYSDLQKLPNVILTPHIGGSTEEAQQNIADFVPCKIINYIQTGCSIGCLTIPNLQLPELKKAHRLIHIHRNVPGILAKINNILARHQINIVGQYLGTNPEIGYVITDIHREYDPTVIQKMRSISQTINLRILY